MFNGKLIIITAPSGAGKTTIVKYLLQQIPNLAFSVSATTRPIRLNETNGIDYYFLTADNFAEKIRNDEFAEWEEVYPGKFYGTLKSELERLWNEKKHIVFDVDVKGALNLQQNYRDRSLSIFIKPPSIDILIERLKNRKTETAESIAARVERYSLELAYEDKFDRVIINDDLATAQQEALDLVNKFIN